MNIFSKRYLTIILSFFLAFSAIAFFFGLKSFAIALFVLAVLSAVLFFIFGKKAKNITVVLILIFMLSLAGGVNSLIYCGRIDAISEKYSGEVCICGYVANVNYRSDYYSEYKIKVESVSGKSEDFYAIFNTEFDAGLYEGDFFSADVTASEITSADEEDDEYYDSDCILLCSADKLEDITYENSRFRFPLILSKLNTRLSTILTSNIKGSSGKLASALMLGKRELLSGDITRDFRRTGIYHMLSLSGAHISIIVGIFEMLLKKISVPKKIRFIILSLVSLFYVALTGFLLSACRSLIMLWLVYISYCFGRRADTMTSLFAAVSVIVAISPQSVSDIGLLLSFISTFGVIVSFTVISRFRFMTDDISGRKIKICFIKIIRIIFAALISSLCVSVLTLPVLCAFFGEMSLATFITNIFIGSLCEIFMFLCLAVMAFSFFPPALWLFSVAAGSCGDLIRGVISCISGVPNIVLSLKYPFSKAMIWGLFIISVIFLAIKLKKTALLLLPVAVFAFSYCIGIVIFEASRADVVICDYLSEASNDAFVLSCGTKNYVIDLSDGGYDHFYDVFSLAGNNCYTETDGMIISHYHKDHATALERLCSGRMIRKIFLPRPESEDEFLILSSIFRKIDSKETEIVLYEYDEMLNIGQVSIVISRPSYDGKTVHSAQALRIGFKNDLVTYAGKGFFDDGIYYDPVWDEVFLESDDLICGAHGRSNAEAFEKTDLAEKTKIYISNGILTGLEDSSNNNIFFDIEYARILMYEKKYKD